mmetsp:Transcript_4674/g.16694  ORF Transcript_4674/g.16694 Transcript_4674/m.16694 type:complete len:497 (-) Transcript_4674:280-1770(-)
MRRFQRASARGLDAEDLGPDVATRVEPVQRNRVDVAEPVARARVDAVADALRLAEGVAPRRPCRVGVDGLDVEPEAEGALAGLGVVDGGATHAPRLDLSVEVEDFGVRRKRADVGQVVPVGRRVPGMAALLAVGPEAVLRAELREGARVADLGHAPHVRGEARLSSGEAKVVFARVGSDDGPLGVADGVSAEAADVPLCAEFEIPCGQRQQKRRLRDARAEEHAARVDKVDDEALDSFGDALLEPDVAVQEKHTAVEDARVVGRQRARRRLAVRRRRRFGRRVGHSRRAVAGLRRDAPRSRLPVRLGQRKVDVAREPLRAVLDGGGGAAAQVEVGQLSHVAADDDVRVEVQDALGGEDVRQVKRGKVERGEQLLALHSRRVAQLGQRHHRRPARQLLVESDADGHVDKLAGARLLGDESANELEERGARLVRDEDDKGYPFERHGVGHRRVDNGEDGQRVARVRRHRDDEVVRGQRVLAGDAAAPGLWDRMEHLLH